MLQVNDLDLTVRATGLSGYTLHGNGQPDHLNNVEQARSLKRCLVCVHRALRPSVMAADLFTIAASPGYNKTLKQVDT